MATMKSSSFKIILGSSSKARRQILEEMGYDFTIMTADIDEKGIRKEKPEELVMALAEAKADAIVSNLQAMGYSEEDSDTTTLLITADTGQSEKNHPARTKRANLSKVYFHDIPDEIIDDLIEEGGSLNVAGGLMLEHPLTLPFVESVVGTTDCVMGLPKALTQNLIQEAL
ncbi:uncharacterized protein LOC131149393 isoform X2 [Malania oleifera]|uniref:uncharacterized protein LOC131149393 isoform X2 n=1 Tax=Malania oleifera TaxID=397392 RepID=UPI0025ADF927|nr:uncharacterized protein LOC131149393 isoform X2 [Malania oleifera]